MKNYIIEIKWTLIFFGSLIAWMLLEKLVGLHDVHIDKHQYLTMLYMPIAIAIYVFALLDKKKNFYAGQMNFKQGFLAGMIITLIVAALSPLGQWIISYIITPDYFNNVIAYSLESGYFKTLEEAQAQFNFKSYVIQSTVGALIMGILTSLIVAAFTRSKN